MINKYIEAHQEEMRLLELRITRSGVVKRALYEFFKKEGIIQETPHSVKIQGGTAKLDDFLV